MRLTAAFLFFLTFYPQAASAQNEEALCKLQEKRHEIAGAAYKPGVDINGNPVTTADLGAAPPLVPDVVRIPLTVDLAKRLGVAPPPGVGMESALGTIEVYKDGKVRINGDDYTAKTAVLCGKEPSQSGQKITAPSAPVKPAVPAPAAIPEDEIIWGEGH